MPFSDGISASSPGPGTSLEDSLAYYKAQYESLEAELADFQESSKALESELEKDIEASEKRERQLKERANNLQYEVDEWKTKHKQAKQEANAAQNILQKEITTLRDANRTLELRLRDTEVVNDDFERKQRNTESSLEDLETKYNQTIERGVMLEEEMKSGEMERESLRIEAQRLKDEFSDLKIETDITKEKLRKAEAALERRYKPLTLQPGMAAGSPRSELSPTETSSDRSIDTPPTKTASTSGLSDAPTPPSPPFSEKSTNTPKPFATPGMPKSRMSITNNTTPRPSTVSTRQPHTRTQSVQVPNGRATPSATFRQSMSRPLTGTVRQPGLPQSNSIYHLRNLRGKMQKLEERVHTAKSKLPAPTDTPPKASPRSAAMSHTIPASVTVRSSKKRTTGSIISSTASLPDQDQSTPSRVPTIRNKPSRPSFGLPSPATSMAPPRPSSRASNVSHRSSLNPNTFNPGHSRPGSRASISGLRAPMSFAPNASTDRVRPKSSLSNHGYDGAADDSLIEDVENVEPNEAEADFTTPTLRRTTFGRRTSEIGSAIPTPSPSKRASGVGVVVTGSKLPAAARRESANFGRTTIVRRERESEMRPPSSHGTGRASPVKGLSDVGEGEVYDVSETF